MKFWEFYHRENGECKYCFEKAKNAEEARDHFLKYHAQKL